MKATANDYITADTILACGHAPKPEDLPAGGLGQSGYATLNDHTEVNGKALQPGDRICYECAADLYRAAAKRGEPITAYVSYGGPSSPKDRGWQITTWTGHRLGFVTVARKSKARWQGSMHIPEMYSIRANIGGRMYYGRSQGPGMYINLRPVKG